MLHTKKLLMIGATGRNSGKTELAVSIIKNFCKKYKIIGIKVSTYHGNDEHFHGQNQIHLKKSFIIEKDTDTESKKNTAKMLVAGATEVYWIKSKAEYLENAINKLLPELDKNAFIVCESNSLRKVVKPDIFIMIRNDQIPVKDSASEVINMADIIIESDGKNFINFNTSYIAIVKEKWILNADATRK